ncbi:MAG TPA: tetratricopeptide repeat-containing protein kinase family protein, partial [Roseiflexaceae bacterium]
REWRMANGELSSSDAPPSAIPVHTDTGQFVGTLPWASPEQLEARSDAIDTRTDVYALGVILYHALTGAFPYPVGGRLADLVHNISAGEPVRPGRLEARVDHELDTIVLKCLSKQRERRYQNAGELARDLRHYLAGEPIEAKRDSTAYVLRKHLRRHRAAVMVASAMLLMLIAGLAVSLSLWGRAEQQHRVAEQRRIHAEAVTGLLEQMLTPADPHKARHSGYTARQLLDEFAAGLRGSAAADIPPEVEATVRTIVGSAYRGLGETHRAAEHLDAALRLHDTLATENVENHVYTLIACAWVRHDHGDYDGAAQAFEQARALLSTDTDSMPYRADVLQGLADLHRHRGEFAQAESLARQALEIIEARFGPQDRRVALARQQLAEMLRARGQLVEAGPLVRDALSILRRECGDDHPLVAAALSELAALREEQGAFAEAEELCREALAIRRRTLPDDHPEVAAALDRLGAISWRQGHYPEADQALREALALKRRILGDNDPDIAVTLGTLVLIAKERGELAEAEALGREALAILRRHGQERPNLAATLSNLAWVLHARGDLEGAEPLFREGLEVARQVYGETHPVVAAAANNLGTLLLTRGQHAAAEPLFEAALRTWEGAYGRKHPHVAACLANLAKVHQGLGEPGEAESLLREALEINRELLGRKHPSVANNLASLADLLQRRGEPAAAEPLLRECLEIRRANLPEEHWIIGFTQCLLGACLAAQGRNPAAEELLTAGYQALSAAGKAPESALKQALEELARFYEQTGQSDQAAAYRTKLAQLQ